MLYDWVHRGVVPIVGPTTLSGQHLGPIFYYLLLPGYFLFNGPVGVCLWIAFLGIVATYILYRSVFVVYGRFPALFVSVLYAVSPAIVQTDRIIWEPNLVPLFSIVFVWLAILQHERVSFWLVVAQGVACGILIQLHYPNVFFIALLGLVALGHSIRVKRWNYLFAGTVGWIIGFLIVMAPFLFYEYTHGFSDIRGTVDIVVRSSSGVGKRQMIYQAWEYSGRVIGKMLPNVHTPAVVAFLTVWFVFLMRNRTSWNIFWTVWFAFGIMSIGKYSGVVFDHYLNFIIPVPFLMLASIVSKIQSDRWKKFALVVLGFIVIVQLGKIDVFQQGDQDIARTKSAIQQIIKDSGKTPFSFALIRSKSFSDLHYRYYFRVIGREPLPVTSKMNSLLYLICDQEVCPSVSELTSQKNTPIICYKAFCSNFYPSIKLENIYSFIREESIVFDNETKGIIYIFKRR